MRPLRSAVALAAVLLAAAPARANDAAAAWAALAAGGHYALMRHAHAPGFGDPAAMRLGDCATQRNLDEAGRAQARAAGAGLRRRGVTIFKVYASRWCRTMETAELLAVADVEPLDALNSFFAAREREAAQTRHIAALIGEPIRTPSVLLVTHDVNIAALTAQRVGSGEIVVVKPLGAGKFAVVGRIDAAAQAP